MDIGKITEFDTRPINKDVYENLPNFQPISHPLLRLMFAIECGAEHDGGKEIKDAMKYYNENHDKWQNQY